MSPTMEIIKNEVSEFSKADILIYRCDIDGITCMELLEMAGSGGRGGVGTWGTGLRGGGAVETWPNCLGTNDSPGRHYFKHLAVNLKKSGLGFGSHFKQCLLNHYFQGLLRSVFH